MKSVIVTGGGHGIGKAIAIKLLNHGYRVFVLDCNPTYLSELNKETDDNSSLKTLICDVGNPEQILSAIQTISAETDTIDCIVNNAGISYSLSIEEMSIETWNRITSVNLSSIFYLVKLGLHLLATPSSIINIASTRALMSESDGEAYAASKGGIISLTHAMSVSLGPKTRVNCISPGWIDTHNYSLLSTADHEQHPCGRVGNTNDIAEMVLFLISDKAEFITGQNFIVDGGMTKKMIYV